MRDFQVTAKGLRGRFDVLQEGQVISETNLSLAGHDVEALIVEGKVRDIAAVAPAPGTDAIQALVLAEKPIPIRDLHHMKAKALGLTKSADGESWVKAEA